MRALDTQYKGYRFRSRLEARWAVFFDALGIEYQYEPQGYELRPVGLPRPIDEGGADWENDDKYGPLPYLPDFWLPQQECWIEIKPTEPSTLEVLKAARLSAATQKDVYLFFGPIPYPLDELNLDIEGEYDGAYRIFAGGDGMDNHYQWCECPACGRLGIEFSGYGGRIDRCDTPYEPITLGTPRLASAYAAARSARFEHGERGPR